MIEGRNSSALFYDAVYFWIFSSDFCTRSHYMFQKPTDMTMLYVAVVLTMDMEIL